jgi:hypothetical protein
MIYGAGSYGSGWMTLQITIADTTIDILHKRRRHDLFSLGRALKSRNSLNPALRFRGS